MKNKPVIRIFHNMARSGGTMVCKCIGAMSGVRLFSEIHPEGNKVKYLNVVDQAHRWYGLASEQEVAAKLPFVAGVQKIAERCAEQQCSMVLRDWASADFIGHLVLEKPVYEFSLNRVLDQHFDIRAMALVRHPLDQWLSTSRLKIYTGKLDAEQFFMGYRRYAEQVANHFVRYEDFSRAPGESLKTISDHLDLVFDPGCLQRWHLNQHITGDNKKSSRGSQGTEGNVIRPMPRRAIDPDLLDSLERNSDYLHSLRLLGYQKAGPG